MITYPRSSRWTACWENARTGSHSGGGEILHHTLSPSGRDGKKSGWVLALLDQLTNGFESLSPGGMMTNTHVLKTMEIYIVNTSSNDKIYSAASWTSNTPIIEKITGRWWQTLTFHHKNYKTHLLRRFKILNSKTSRIKKKLNSTLISSKEVFRMED